MIHDVKPPTPPANKECPCNSTAPARLGFLDISSTPIPGGTVLQFDFDWHWLLIAGLCALLLYQALDHMGDPPRKGRR